MTPGTGQGSRSRDRLIWIPYGDVQTEVQLFWNSPVGRTVGGAGHERELGAPGQPASASARTRQMKAGGVIRRCHNWQGPKPRNRGQLQIAGGCRREGFGVGKLRRGCQAANSPNQASLLTRLFWRYRPGASQRHPSLAYAPTAAVRAILDDPRLCPGWHDPQAKALELRVIDHINRRSRFQPVHFALCQLKDCHGISQCCVATVSPPRLQSRTSPRHQKQVILFVFNDLNISVHQQETVCHVPPDLAKVRVGRSIRLARSKFPPSDTTFSHRPQRRSTPSLGILSRSKCRAGLRGL
jgi:hypothetical protein